MGRDRMGMGMGMRIGIRMDWRKSSRGRLRCHGLLFDFTVNPSFEHAKAHLSLVKCFEAHGMIKDGSGE